MVYIYIYRKMQHQTYFFILSLRLAKQPEIKVLFYIHIFKQYVCM